MRVDLTLREYRYPCDGPMCDSVHIWRYVPICSWPRNWIHVEIHTIDGIVKKHFCSYRCLANWASELGAHKTLLPSDLAFLIDRDRH